MPVAVIVWPVEKTAILAKALVRNAMGIKDKLDIKMPQKPKLSPFTLNWKNASPRTKEKRSPILATALSKYTITKRKNTFTPESDLVYISTAHVDVNCGFCGLSCGLFHTTTDAELKRHPRKENPSRHNSSKKRWFGQLQSRRPSTQVPAPYHEFVSINIHGDRQLSTAGMAALCAAVSDASISDGFGNNVQFVDLWRRRIDEERDSSRDLTTNRSIVQTDLAFPSSTVEQRSETDIVFADRELALLSTPILEERFYEPLGHVDWTDSVDHGEPIATSFLKASPIIAPAFLVANLTSTLRRPE
ncbi:hypothetical protein SISNIDRAFT_494632 [Sistotremastrum niveocremeum HHB9708]|uniref:Uncharacterized protein n=2 Tax=Sistotremastraceae TaxID=3402574 RepID=A0A164WS44_9AGAM|nr:hypothetical protein SISNIDRAFT_494632 [Sistotremastrum niveocremeum HHB9708]KZT38388.1 hypothetical protein SISSUDRAFT_1119658 [Sistotremastrum suecicum HHB10207 ss-3]